MALYAPLPKASFMNVLKVGVPDRVILLAATGRQPLPASFSVL